MAREFFCAYHSYLNAMRKLSDAECGRLFRALLSYSAGEQLINLQGREEILFDVFADQIDRDNAKYEAKCRKNRENGAMANGTERRRTVPNAPQEKEKDKEKDKGEVKKESKKKQEESTMTKTMKIEGMMCGHCEARVKKTLEAIDGVKEAVVSHEAGTAVVTLEKEVADEVLKNAVEAQDYPVKGIE